MKLVPRPVNVSLRRLLGVWMGFSLLCGPLPGQQPAEPQDPSPLDGEMYYLVNQISGLQADLNAGSTADGATLVQNSRSFTSLTQRWALTLAPSGNWKISNIANGLCMDTQQTSTPVATVQQPCAINTPSQEWTITYVTNGYSTLQNAATGLLLDISGSSTAVNAPLVQTVQATTPTQSQLWLLRPAFFRGNDNALLGKQEADRLAVTTPFFNDAGQVQDSLQILKSHGVNLVRLRPAPLVVPGTTTPLYTTYTPGSGSNAIPATCTGNGCTAETDAADLALAQRAKALGMSIELTLFFDGASSKAAPGGWAGYTSSQMSAAIYTYVKAQIEEYRSAGVMPDIVSIGNEVDTGFLATGVASGASGSPSGAYNSAAFTNFATYQKQGMQAVLDAASDATLGPALPAPLRCIHTTPAWLISSFYAEADQAGIPYDMVCESYYPIDHGPLTSAQAASCSTTSPEPEQTNLANGASAIGKPILMIEIGERYETGYGKNDCFYPVSRAGQRQFALDMQSTLKGLTNNLGAGIMWWDATGTNVPLSGGSYANYDASGIPADLYYWDGFTLFDDADNGAYVDNFSAPTYNSVLPALTALGGKLDATLAYKLVNVANGRILETASLSGGAGAALDTGVDSGVTSLHQQWQISSNGDGYFQIANLNMPGGTANVLDNGASTTAGSLVTQQPADLTPQQEWDVITAGNGTFTIVNKQSGFVLGVDTSSNSNGAVAGAIEQQAPTATNADWITPAGSAQQWKIIPVHVSGPSTAAALLFSTPPPSSVQVGSPLGAIAVTVQDGAGETVTSPPTAVTLTITGPSSYSQTFTANSALGAASFALTTTALPNVGAYTVTASATGLTSAVATLTATPATLTVSANNLSRLYGVQNPALTYAVTGFVNGDTQSVLSGAPALSTTATAASAVGAYPITISGGTLTAANYNFVYNNGTLTVTPATPSVTLVSSENPVLLQNAVTLTTTVSSANGAPTGTVSFYDGTSATPISSSPLVNGSAAFSTSSLTFGSHSITAVYSGDANFASQSSAAVIESVQDFSIATAAGSSSSQTVQPGGTATFGLTLAPLGSTALPAAVTLSASGLPTGSTYTLLPTVVPSGAGSTNVTLTIQAPQQTAALEHLRSLSDGLAPVVLALLLLPIPRRSTKKLKQLRLPKLLVLLGAGVVLGIAGCGGSHSPALPPPQSYSLVITGTSGPLSHSLNVTLTVQ